MRKSFNIEGACHPDENYMVNPVRSLSEIQRLVGNGKYFTINRARQFGKTTILHLLEKKLQDQYVIFSISFEGLAKESYGSQDAFCRTFAGLLYDTIVYGEVQDITENVQEACGRLCRPDGDAADFRALSNFISVLCHEAQKPVILMIDEVDQAGSQEVFLSFLGMLRNKYLNRGKRPTFQSVILAALYDIKNLKLRHRSEGEGQFNSPWNIATELRAEMNFPQQDIEGMLREYEEDSHTGMDVMEIAGLLYKYTAGYPYLVSFLCKIADEEFSCGKNAWTKTGILEAVQILVKGPNTLYDGKIFLMYLKPIINGAGNFYVEDKSRSRIRSDVVVDYHGRQYVIEIKIWRGKEYIRKGERQLLDYLDAYGQKKEYLLIYNFNQKKETGVQEYQWEGKTILEVMV